MKKKILSLIVSVSLILSLFVIPATALQSDDYFSSMSTEDKISQMLMPAFRYIEDEEGIKKNVTEINGDIQTALKKHSFSGVILFGQNTPTNENTVRLVDAMQKANAEGGDRPQLLISIDQEGGRVTRLDQGTVTSGNMALGAINDISVTKASASIIGSELKALGINVDFAPVVDINSNPSNPVIGVRSFSDDPETVSQHGTAFTETLNETGMISTLKHFPGHGDTGTDSHTGLPCVNKTYDEIKQNELVPFQACIDAGSQMIMTAHIQYPQIETNTYRSKLTNKNIYLPATLSKTIITNVLREEMGFDGVVITDAMEMDAIAKHFDKYDAAKLAIEAGVDILLIPVETISKEGSTAGFAELDEYISKLAKMADDGDISMDKINAAVKRILALKENNGLFASYDGSDIEERAEYAVNNIGSKENHDKEWEIAKQAVTLVKNDNDTLPLKNTNEKTVVLVPYDDETIPMEYAVRKLTDEGKLPEGAVVEAYSYKNKTVDDMLPKTADADNVVFLSEMYKASFLSQDVARMADTICGEIHSRQGKFIVMSVNLPYDIARYPDADAIMAVYLAVSMPETPGEKVREMKSYGANMPAGLYVMFSEEDAPTAKLPINIPGLDDSYSYTDNILYERGFGLTYSSDPTGVFSSEYKSSPFYKKLIAALDNSEDKTTMEKALAAALSQEGYKNYAIEGADLTQSKARGLIWTGKELRMNDYETGNTEYTRWLQSCVLNYRSQASLLADYDWCAVFASWCMYQAGYYTDEQLKKFYYSYCADPRIEFDADAWIEAFCFDQEKVWYTPIAARKVAAYDWNTYYHTEVDPYDIPYKPGGLIFFSWNGTGDYFNHVAMVVSYDSETHELTYINGNTEGQVITRMMDLDNVEEFHGNPIIQNSGRIMAYGEYDAVKPLEQKEITAEQNVIIWDKNSGSGFSLVTDSDSKIVSVTIDNEYIGSNIESNILMHQGKVKVGRSELVDQPAGLHELMLTFDDGVLTMPLIVEEKRETDISSYNTELTWDRADGDIEIATDSTSAIVTILKGDEVIGTEEIEDITVENGTVTLSGEFANSVFEDGANTIKLVFSDGDIDINIFVTDNSEESSESSEESEESQTSETSEESEQSETSETSETSEESETSGESEISETSESSQTSEISESSETSEASSASEVSESSAASEPSRQTETTTTATTATTETRTTTETPFTGDGYPIAIIVIVAASICLIGVTAKKKHDSAD